MQDYRELKLFLDTVLFMLVKVKREDSGDNWVQKAIIPIHKEE